MAAKYKRPRKRAGEHTCRCAAYPFPHRFGGGKCNGSHLAADYWEESWGGGECQECHCLDKSEDFLSCQVVLGQENVTHCNYWRAFVHTHEIRLYGQLRRWAESG